MAQTATSWPVPEAPAGTPAQAPASPWDGERVARQFAVSRETMERLAGYADLLAHWQARINLVGRSTLADVWGRHIADSLQLIDLAPTGARTWLDLGTGAGLPGLVLAIALRERDGFHMHLVESNAKKCAFLRTAAARLGAPVTVHETRIEALAGDPERPRAEVITARALAPLGRLVGLARPFMWKRTMLLLPKGQDVEIELTEASISSTLTVDRRPSAVDPAATILLIEETR